MQPGLCVIIVLGFCVLVAYFERPNQRDPNTILSSSKPPVEDILRKIQPPKTRRRQPTWPTVFFTPDTKRNTLTSTIAFSNCVTANGVSSPIQFFSEKERNAGILCPVVHIERIG